MASASKRSPKRGGSKKKNTSAKKVNAASRTKNDYILGQEIKAVVIFAVSIILFLCNFGLIGKFGDILSAGMFGLFGLLAYAAPLLLGFIIVFMMINEGNGAAIRKTVSGAVLFIAADMLLDMFTGISKTLEKYDIKALFSNGSVDKRGGGVIASSLNYLLIKCIDKVGTYIVIILIIVICLILITGKSLVSMVEDTKDSVQSRKDENKEFQQEYIEERELRRKERSARSEERRRKIEEAKATKDQAKQQKDDEKVLRKNKKAVGVTKDTVIVPDTSAKDNYDDVHEIILNGFDPTLDDMNVETAAETPLVHSINDNRPRTNEIFYEPDLNETDNDDSEDVIVLVDEPVKEITKPVAKPDSVKTSDISAEINNKPVASQYEFPPIDLLKKGSYQSKTDSAQEIRDTSRKLQETLAIFGVEATVTDISQGPTVTRFELQPKVGVKVSKIKNLSDDIKLNLAASDIRIEAPIPGKAAIGIEVPNKVNQAVLFRDLIENNDFKNFNSNLAFAVGKDISGKNIIFDIDKFPHLLIAGATGSGKSVCINTLIMSILYKANPDDVKLIMIDPKVVELSVYNGIPHLLLPVVTDAKKAAATLNYAVNEMMERYKKFADMNTRDLAGYNREVESRGESEIYKKLPQIVIIVDELADLIMVAKNDVEDAICRLAQLARAAGIHLIIATQRPSVDVITGLIKANMPSRIAFAVSSGTDSRTILDMGGAEELLGRGDMLFFPKGLKKPVRLQGGYVDDQEVNKVVDFLKQRSSVSYDADIEQKISVSMTQTSHQGAGGADDNASGYDDMFIEAGRFIIETNKASIGMLQRKFKMGFNRAARVMDQLAEAGVVGPDEGTKPRAILMGPDQFENFIENEM